MLGWSLLALSTCRDDNKGTDGIELVQIETKDSSDRSILKGEYDFDKADDVLVLDMELSEISGLDFDSSTSNLLANNDEKGDVFYLDPNSGKITGKESIAKKGDYEGVEVMEEQIILVKSNGTLYFYDKQDKDKDKVRTSLSATNDVEGLAYDEFYGLLLACKGQPLHGGKQKNAKEIYVFDFENKAIDSTPFLRIEDEELMLFDKNRNHTSKAANRKLVKRLKSFSPSGIAVNPDSKDIYIVSAKGSILLIYDQTKGLSSIHYLDDKILPQPEGICFDDDLNLYISTEGKGFSGKIFVFKPK